MTNILSSIHDTMYTNDENNKEENSVLAQIEHRAEDMIVNHTNGFVFKLSAKDYILRILILGTTNNTYYQKDTEVTEEAHQFIKTQIEAGNGQMILDTLEEVYLNNRAPRHNNLAVVHALLTRAGLPLVQGSKDTHIKLRQAAYNFVTKYRTLSQFYSWQVFNMIIVKSKGFGSGTKNAISKWITTMDPLKFAYQATKYQSRTINSKTISLRDILRMAHTKTNTGEDRVHKIKDNNHITKYDDYGKNATPTDIVLRYIVNGFNDAETLAKKAGHDTHQVFTFLKIVHDVSLISSKPSTEEEHINFIKKLCDMIYTSQSMKTALVREHMPTWALKNVDVLNALLMNKEKTHIIMPIVALLRNLGNLSTNNVFADDHTVDLVVSHLTDKKIVVNTRAHPVQIMLAWSTYKSGRGVRGSNTWEANTKIVTALEEMFYISFVNCVPTGKRIFFAIDCSGSMDSPSAVPQISNAEAAALLAMVFCRAECVGINDDKPLAQHTFKLFTKKAIKFGTNSNNRCDYDLTDVSDLIHAKATFNDVHKAVRRSDFGLTNPSEPILDALKYNQLYDAFVIITDNEVNSGIHPSTALKEYREKLVPNAKMIVVATSTTNFSIADPKDPGMMDVVGFDSHGPKIIQDFIRGLSTENINDDCE